MALTFTQCFVAAHNGACVAAAQSLLPLRKFDRKRQQADELEFIRRLSYPALAGRLTAAS
jgi:hypothetical protein